MDINELKAENERLKKELQAEKLVWAIKKVRCEIISRSANPLRNTGKKNMKRFARREAMKHGRVAEE